jgi:hypothetical protein
MGATNGSVAVREICVDIGGTPILLRTPDGEFRNLLAQRYSGFVSEGRQVQSAFDIDYLSPELLVDAEKVEEEEVQEDASAEPSLRVRHDRGRWHLERGDFRAEWDSANGQGRIALAPTPYGIDAILRVVHSLIQARQGGFLLHGASAIRNGKAFLFSGVSGAGKSTISRLAPADATLLTDEISYIRCQGGQYFACGTPFAGELEKPGENVQAPVQHLFFLAKGEENRIEPIKQTDALRVLLRNILFFADDSELVGKVFRTACEFLERVPVSRLTFFPDKRVWELVQ